MNQTILLPEEIFTIFFDYCVYNRRYVYTVVRKLFDRKCFIDKKFKVKYFC